MSVSFGGLLIIAISIIMYVRRPDLLPKFMIVLTVFGASAGLFIAGKPIQPGLLVMGFAILAVARFKRTPNIIANEFAHNASLKWLTAFVAYSVIISILAPTLFAGETMVYRPLEGEMSFVLQPLEFGSSHLAQLTYLIGSYLSFILIVVYRHLDKGLWYLVSGLQLASALNIGFGLIDLISYKLGFTEALFFLKNAGYANVDQVMLGVRRIAGSFSETSAFTGYSVTLLAFNLFLYLGDIHKERSKWLSIGLFMLVLISTSSSGYVGLATLAMILCLTRFRAMLFATLRRPLLVILLSICAIWVGYMLIDTLTSITEKAILTKLDTQSGEERMGWNLQGLQNLIDTAFIGVGIGGNRVSSFAVAVLSNAGIIGFIFYLGFLITALRSTPTARFSHESTILGASRIAVVVSIAPSLVNATTPFRGILFMALISMCSPSSCARRNNLSTRYARSEVTGSLQSSNGAMNK